MWDAIQIISDLGKTCTERRCFGDCCIDEGCIITNYTICPASHIFDPFSPPLSIGARNMGSSRRNSRALRLNQSGEAIPVSFAPSNPAIYSLSCHLTAETFAGWKIHSKDKSVQILTNGLQIFNTTMSTRDGPLYLGFDLSTQQLKGGPRAKHLVPRPWLIFSSNCYNICVKSPLRSKSRLRCRSIQVWDQERCPCQ